MGFPLQKNGEKIGDTMAVAAGGLWIRGPAGSGKNASVEGEKKSPSATGGVKTCDWNAKQERKAKVAKEGAKVGLS